MVGPAESEGFVNEIKGHSNQNNLKEFVMPVINTNKASMATPAASNLKNSTQSALERLSSGQRINSGREDAAGLAVASALASQASQLSARMAERTAAKTDSSTQAAQSVSDSRALTVAANDALSPFEGSLRRMRDLAVATSAEDGGVLDDTDRQRLQTEFSEIRKQMDQFVGQAEYDGKNSSMVHSARRFRLALAQAIPRTSH